MKTRVGKIAQLPKEIRDELNQRLENGKQGPELLKWLNSLPETKQLLAEKFDQQPVTNSNLSDWRQGGHQDWQRLQAREQRIERISESGSSLEQRESGDLFENFARMAIAELAADLESLDDLKNPDARWQRLRELCRELARLQNGYNRSRRTELAWTKHNDRFLGPEDYENDENPKPNPSVVAFETADTQNSKPETKPFVPDRAKSFGAPVRYVHRAPCGCICRKCHPPDGPYPYCDAERDSAARKSSELIQQENGESFYLYYWPCDCTCSRCHANNANEPADRARKSVFRLIHHTKCSCNGICQKCHGLESEYPLSDVLRDEALIREHKSSIIRGADGISTSVRSSFCGCPVKNASKTKSNKFPQLKVLPFDLPKSR